MTANNRIGNTIAATRATGQRSEMPDASSGKERLAMVKGVQSSLIRHAWEQHHHLNPYGKNRRNAIAKVMSLQKEGARWIPARYHSLLVLENVPLGSHSAVPFASGGGRLVKLKKQDQEPTLASKVGLV